MASTGLAGERGAWVIKHEKRTPAYRAMVSDMRSIIRVAQARQGQPIAVIFDGRTLQSSCESGTRAGYDDYKRRNGSKSAYGSRYAGLPGCLDGHIRKRARTRPGRCAVRAGAARNWQYGQAPLGQTRVIRASRLRATPPDTALNCKWSSWRRLKKALCCCPGAGWSSAALAGAL